MNISNVRVDAHVVPSHGFWAVKIEGTERTSGYWYTKLEATSFAMDFARNNRSSVVVHGANGVIQNVWSYDAFRGIDELTTNTTKETN